MLGRVVPLEPLDQTAGLVRGERLVERRRRVRIQIILYENDLVGTREVAVAEGFQDFGKVDRRAPLGDLDMTPAFERGEQHEQVGCAISFVLVVVARGLSRQHRQRRARLGDELL